MISDNNRAAASVDSIRYHLNTFPCQKIHDPIQTGPVGKQHSIPGQTKFSASLTRITVLHFIENHIFHCANQFPIFLGKQINMENRNIPAS